MNKSILKNKYYLYITEFFAGVSVMAVELGASRLLAPYFSSSQVVYTIIIGTVMIAMALGNIYGGKSADKNPNPDILYRRLIISALWIAAIPVLGKYLIILIAGAMVLTISTNFLAVAAFLSCMAVFVFPLFLLGTVTPSLVKYTIGSVEDSGSTVGMMEACNTIGSIIGTFLPTFVTIPAVGTAATFLIFSGVLMAIALIYFISEKRAKRLVVIGIVVFLICCIFGHSSAFAFWEEDLTYEGESIYNYLQVKDSERSTILSTNVLFGVQSIYVKDGDLTGMYYDYALAAPCAAAAGDSQPLDILILGNGTGTFATQCSRYFEGSRIEGVEIDGKITALAEEYFNLPENVKVTEYDGRAYLAAIDGKYDVIQVDAYQDITIPFQMSSVEFFTMVKEHLNEGGIMVVNMNMYSDGEGSINEYLTDTICSVFPNVYTADVARNTNRELYACCGDDFNQRLSDAIGGIKDSKLRKMMSTVRLSLVKQEGGSHILTDDKAPVEVLGMKMIDKLIAEELEYYKEIYRNEGFKGLINNI